MQCRATKNTFPKTRTIDQVAKGNRRNTTRIGRHARRQRLIPFQRENQLKGEDLLFAFSDISVLEINDELQEKKVKFYLKVLEAGKLLKEQELVKSVIWRHKEVEKTLLLLREWDIRLDEELIRKEKISVCQLIFFNFKNLKKIFGVDKKEGMQTLAKLEKLRKEFKAFL